MDRPEPTGRVTAVWRVALVVLAVQVVGSLVIAVAMSALDDHLREWPVIPRLGPMCLT